MRKTWLGLFAAIALVGALPAFAAIPQDLSPNHDGTYDTNYRAGDKPIDPPASCPTGFTCAALGTAVGEIDEPNAGEFAISASGPDDIDDIVFGYKAFASGDVQIIAQVPDQANWTGYAENFTGFGVRCQEGLDPPDWIINNWVANTNDTARLKHGVPGATTTVQGDGTTPLPKYLGVTYDDSEAEYGAWQSPDGSTWTRIGIAVPRNSGAINCGVFGTSQEAGQTSFATLTDVASATTLSIYTPGTAPAFTAAPAAGTPSETTIPVTFTVDQTGFVFGTACANGTAGNVAETNAGQCTGGAAAASTITTPVTATVAAAASFLGLTASTTYDLSFLPVSDLNGAAAAVTSVADIATDDSEPPPGTASCTRTAAAFPPTNATINSGEYLTANVNCGKAEDIVAGFDFSTPPDAPIAATGGLFDVDNTLPDAAIKGNRLYHAKIQWDEVEPANDNGDPAITVSEDYDWSSVDAAFTAAAAGNYDGVVLHLRHTVADITSCDGTPANGTPVKLSEHTAPAWAEALAATIDMGCHAQGFRIENLNLDNATVQAEVREFIREFAAQDYKTRANFRVVIHFASSSSGEECCAGFSEATQNAIIDEWTTGFGANAGKLAWLGENPPGPANNAIYGAASGGIGGSAIPGGTGMRGGIAENCMRSQYLPGSLALTGQALDANGYLTTSQSFAPIANGRFWMDELEFHTLLAQSYFFCSIRMMQMQRSEFWVYEAGSHNIRLTDWMSTIMGHLLADRAEGWAFLTRTNGGAATPKIVNNFESGIKQREALGATTPTNKIAHVDGLSGSANFPTTHANCNYDGDSICNAAAWSRRENNATNTIGFALDNTWWPGSLTHDAVVKVTYYDSSTAGSDCRIRNSAGATLATWDADAGTNGALYTVTRFIDDFTAPASGDNKDFDIQCDQPVDISFVRIIKNGGAFPRWNE